MHCSTLRHRAHQPFRFHALAVAIASASASSLTPLSAQAQAPETRGTREKDLPADGDQPGVLKTMKINANADPLHFDMPETDGLKADYQRAATKMPLTVRETPQAVSVITRRSLDVRQVQTLGQALELSGAVQTSGNGPFGGQPSFGFNMTTIRGLEIDDLYDFRDDGFISGSYFAIPDLAIYQRVEVVKGPNSVLYGRGSIGGLVNRVRKKPLLETRTELQASVGSYDSYRLDVDTTGPMNTSKTLRGRMVGAYEEEGSFVDGAKTERTVLAPSIEFDVAERTRLLVQSLYQNEDIIPNTGMALRPTGYDADGNVTGYDAAHIRRSQVNGVTNKNPYTWTIKSVQAQLDHEFNDDWFATLRFSKNSIDTAIQVDSYVYGFRDSGDDLATPEIERVGDTSVIGSDYDIERDIWSGEIQLNGRFDIAGREIKVTLGADHTDNDYYRRGIYYNVGGFGELGTDYNLYDGNFDVADQSDVYQGPAFGGDPRGNGAYVQAQISATERLKVLLGARYDKVQLRSFTGDEPIEKETVSDSTGRIGLTYEMNQNISLYALYAQSFQPVLFSFGPAKELLEPESGDIHEIGTKTEWLDKKLAATFAIYRVDRENVPVGVGSGPDAYSISSGLQRADGFEIEINGRPLPGWDVSLSYNNVDSDYEDSHDSSYGDFYAGTADWQLGLFTSYEVQTGALRGFGVGVTRFEIDEHGVSSESPGTLPGYERYDLHAFYKGIEDIEINLTVRNVTDEVYVESADRPGAYAQFGSPTAALLSFKYTID